MIYTLSWHANGGSNTLHMDGSTNPSNGIVTTSRIDAYTLPAGTYHYTAVIGNTSQDYPGVTVVDNSNENQLSQIVDPGVVPPWSTGNGPYHGSFTLASQTNISIRYSNNYYMDNTAVYMMVQDQNSFIVHWGSNGTDTFRIVQDATLDITRMVTPPGITYGDSEGYTLPAGDYTFVSSDENDQNYWDYFTLYDGNNNAIVQVSNWTAPWSGNSGYTGSFTLASPTTVYAKSTGRYYMYGTHLYLTLSVTYHLPPEAPTSLSWVDLYNGHISVSFTPGNDNGTAITNYSYSLDNGATFVDFSPAQTTSPVLITGLSNRSHYNLQLKAINDNGAGAASANLPLYYMCFLEGTKILCFNEETQEEEERAIETLKKGDLVKTYSNGYKPIDTIGTSKIYNPSNSMRSLNRLYRCPKDNYPSLKEDLVITGCHSILVKDITEEERGTLLELQGKIYVTEKNYRLIAAADMKAVPYEQEGFFNIWHFALEHPKYTFNYGVYANGLLVECSSMRMMRELSGMDLME
jgi:hypothetical protein